MKILNELMNFIIFMTSKFLIDESHGLLHSMNVLIYANKIYESELSKGKLHIKKQEKIIYIAALLHDVCDKKYMEEIEGLNHIEKFISDTNKKLVDNNNNFVITEEDRKIILKIISTLSYSKVKIYGYPDLGEYQLAYHIVREADLLTAYDFERCLIFKMNKFNYNFDDAFIDSKKIFEERIFKHFDDNLFVTEFSKNEGKILHNNALKRINSWNSIKNYL